MTTFDAWKQRHKKAEKEKVTLVSTELAITEEEQMFNFFLSAWKMMFSTVKREFNNWEESRNGSEKEKEICFFFGQGLT